MLNYGIEGGEGARLVCPRCNSEEVWKDGIRNNVSGAVQRYQCKNCDSKFSESAVLSNSSDSNNSRQVCDILTESKNLTVVSHGWTTGENDNSRILQEYENFLKREGLRQATIEGYVRSIKSLLNGSVNLFKPDSVKEYLASKDKITEGRKRNIIHAYKQFHVMWFGTEWNSSPKFRRVKKPQYLPLEEILLMIIAGVPNKYKPFCQLLLEAGLSSMEAWTLKWSDINFETGYVNVTPIKNRETRTLPLSNKCLSMIQLLPRDSEYIFKKGKLDSFREGFRKHRVKLAKELNEPKILNCSFKTFRTYFITNCSYKFNDPFEVQYRAGHTQMSTTQLYIRREGSMNREYVSRVTRTIEEAQQAIEQGYHYVTDVEDVKLWQKPK